MKSSRLPAVAVAVAVVLVGGLVGPAGASSRPAAPPTLAASATPVGTDVDPSIAFPESEAGLVGTPLPPSRDVAATKRRQALVRDPQSRASGFPADRLPRQRTAASAPSTTDGTAPSQAPTATDPRGGAYDEVTGFQVSGVTVDPVAPGLRPYDETYLTRAGGFGTLDANGVRMYSFPGETEQWNHPVGQAQYAIANLNSYRLDPDPRFLAIAEANAQRLVDRRVVSADAWYYPYDFDFAVHGDTTQTLRAPWYSAMAQGQALSAFTRLYLATKDATWLEAADRTYLSLVQAPEGDAPFASRVDSAGRLWFEEYPRYPVNQSEMVLNGHIFTMFGLHDYWEVTGRRADVGRLFLGGLRTLELTVRPNFRRTSWASVYSLHHALPTVSYHKTHIAQFLLLWRLTSDPQWISHASVFREDFPEKNVTGTAVIRPARSTIYKLDADKRIVARRTVTFTRETRAPYSTRHRIQGGPKAMRISAGAYTDWWFTESPSVAYPLGKVDVDVYAPAARLVLGAGRTYTAYQVDYRGRVTATRTLRVTHTTSAPTNHSAIVLGRPMWHVSGGSLTGFYIPFQTGVGATTS